MPSTVLLRHTRAHRAEHRRGERELEQVNAEAVHHEDRQRPPMVQHPQRPECEQNFEEQAVCEEKRCASPHEARDTECAPVAATALVAAAAQVPNDAVAEEREEAREHNR